MKKIKQNIKNTSGITLIALVITIIILLILAGITLTLTLGQQGILKQAERAGEKYKQAKKDEEELLDRMNGMVTDLYGAYYTKADELLSNMTLDEKIAQMYIVGIDASIQGEVFSYYQDMKSYQFGGYLFFANFFYHKNESTIKSEIESLKASSKIPLITSIDEEGGTVSRLKDSYIEEPNFLSPSEVYNQGGLEAIKKDTINKSRVLSSLGLNLNFAPVVDIAEEGHFIYKRTLKQDAAVTAEFAKTVIKTSKEDGYDVSYTLKHFPGYGNCEDTHIGPATNNNTLESLQNKDLLPFQAGVDVGVEIIMFSHNIIACMDPNNATSISKPVHDYLRNEMGYTGIIITDAINMGAISTEYSTKDAIIKAIQAGNDMICFQMPRNQKDKDEVGGATLTYAGLIQYVKDAITDGQISEDTINNAVRRILAWKCYKGLI